MDIETADFILSSLPKGRTVYHDFKDRYALLLLEYAIGDEGCLVSELKTGNFSSLMKKSIVKSFLANSGHSNIKSEYLLNAWPEEIDSYRLTLGTWPKLDDKPKRSWNQITRWGWNIVLQLNFSSTHINELNKLVRNWREYAENIFHPIADGDELTLAWSRIDLDLTTGEALIEEIQSDWIRDTKWYSESSRYNTKEDNWKEYYDKFLKPKSKRWSEVMLTATLWFLLKEIGIRQIFYHTHDTGNKLKKINRYLPPRSIYSDLPKKFCFELTHNGPLFIRDSAKKELRNLFRDQETKWYILDFS